MTAPEPSDVDALVEVLTEHITQPCGDPGCDPRNYGFEDPEFIAHLASVLARHVTTQKAEAWDEGWRAAGDAYVAGQSAALAGLPCPDSGDGPPNPYRNLIEGGE